MGCGAVLPETDGPTHRYLESSPACWAAYSQVLAREYASPGLFQGVHRYTVDAYAVQHPGRPAAQSIQSVAVHLMSLCALIENGSTGEWATRLIGEAVRIKGGFTWLQPPGSMGALTVVDVLRAKGASEHERMAKEWAASAWGAWSAHHATVRSWVSSGPVDPGVARPTPAPHERPAQPG
jgi:hypothetical protein